VGLSVALPPVTEEDRLSGAEARRLLASLDFTAAGVMATALGGGESDRASHWTPRLCVPQH